MNTYELMATTICPVNNAIIEISIEIKSCHTIIVENLLNFLQENKNILHEELADKLQTKFGGKQIIKAFHHGVWITTERGSWSTPTLQA